MTKNEPPKKVRWLQRHWVSKRVLPAPTWKGKEAFSVYRPVSVRHILTRHPEVLQSKLDSFQNLHAVVMAVTVKLALMDWTPAPTTGLMTT